MRLLHTADWHLGRAFHGEDLLSAQAAFVDVAVAAAIGTPVAVGDGLVYPIPYLEPDLVRDALAIEQRTHAAALGAAMARVRADLARRGAAVGGMPVVAMAHAFVAGGAPSESER